MKKFYGQRAYVQSAGVKNDMEIDGFSVAVCAEMGIELSRHRSRSFEEMQELGDDLGQYDLIIALSASASGPWGLPFLKDEACWASRCWCSTSRTLATS